MRFNSKILLFCSSYIPLFIIIIVKLINIRFSTKFKYYFVTNPLNYELMVVLVVFVFLILCGLVGLHIVFNKSNHGKTDINIKSVENKTDMVYSYFLPYIFSILPLFDFESISNLSNIIVILILFYIMLVVYVNSDLYLLDPILIVRNYKYYKVTTENDDVIIVLSKVNLKMYERDVIKANFIDNNLYKV